MMWPLLISAIVSLAVIIDRAVFLFFEASNNHRIVTELPTLLLNQRNDEALLLCSNHASLLSSIAKGLLSKHSDDAFTRESNLRETSHVYSRLYVKNVYVLDTVITVAPLLGLLGTVTGMIHSFHVVGHSTGGWQTATVTGGISQALIATAVGLGIAIVTLVAFNFLGLYTSAQIASTESRARDIFAIPAPRTATKTKRIRVVKTSLKRPRIEIIPMIDTIFFLLVFFMISSLTMVAIPSKAVRLPTSVSGASAGDEKIVLSLTKNGDYLVDKVPAQESQVELLVAARLNNNPSGTVVINCDKDQPVSKFLALLSAAKAASPKRIVIATVPH